MPYGTAPFDPATIEQYFEYITVYSNDTPVVNVETDSGVLLTDFADGDSIILNVVYETDADNTKYNITTRVWARAFESQDLTASPRTAETISGGGSTATFLWYSATTGTIHFYIDFDGVSKTLLNVRIVQEVPKFR